MATVDEAPTAGASAEAEAVAWYALPPEEVVARQGVDPERGLSGAEASARLASVGPNMFTAAEARRYVPEVSAADLVPAPSGVRAQALDPDGSLLDDFRIHRLGPITAVRNAPSPGATSSLAIAEHIADAALASG